MNYLIMMPTGALLLLAIFVAEYSEIGYLVIFLALTIVAFIGCRYWMAKLNGTLRLEVTINLITVEFRVIL